CAGRTLRRSNGRARVVKTTSVAVLVVMASVGWGASGCGGERQAAPASAGSGGNGGGGGTAGPAGGSGGEVTPPGSGGAGGTPTGIGGGGGTSSPPLDAWTGISWIRQQGSGSQQTVSADVRWFRVSSAGGIDRYQPSGTATFQFSGGLCTVVVSPSSAPIAPTDGELVIDRRTTPATYTMRGAATWSARRAWGGGPDTARS